jgi:aminoglycoside phosphotransferase (APT) family kinase protein
MLSSALGGSSEGLGLVMRERWGRLTPEITLRVTDVKDLLRPLLSGAVVTAAEPLKGGIANSNFKIIQETGPLMLLRIYQRGVDQALKEVGLMRRLRGDVPVPHVLYFSHANALTGHPYAVMEWIEGTRLDQLADGGSAVATCGASLGKALAEVHAITFQDYGFFDSELALTSRLGFGCEDLAIFIEERLRQGPGASRLNSELTEALAAFVGRQAGCLSQWPGPCLVHGDFNGSNLLFRPGIGGQWELATILDWEFAFSGVPGFDFAHLLRPPLDQHLGLAERAAESYRAAGRYLPRDWRRIARMTDLFAWIDILSLPNADATMIEDARQVLRSTLANW